MAQTDTARSEIVPWEDSAPPPDHNSTRRNQRPIAHGSNDIPSIRQQPPTARPKSPPWNSEWGVQMPTSVFGSSINGSSENLGQASPPGFGRNMSFYDDERRPSVASATTISSTGSKSSVNGRVHKKLQSFFGEEVLDFKHPDNVSRQGSETNSLRGSILQGAKNIASKSRHHSGNDAAHRSRASSPPDSRPRSPNPSVPKQEVTPWEFQDPQSVPDAADSSISVDSTNIRTPKNSSSNRRVTTSSGHRQNRSTEERTSNNSQGMPLRPSTSREDSSGRVRRETTPSSMSSAMNTRPARDISPAPSTSSTHGQHSPANHGGKRSLLDRVTGRKKTERDRAATTDGLQSHSSTSLSGAQNHGLTKPRTDTLIKGKSSSRIKGRRPDTISEDRGGPKDLNIDDEEDDGSVWHLDTDMTNLEGIIDHRKPPMTPPQNDANAPFGKEQRQGFPGTRNLDTGAWDAPDSWAVSKVADDSLQRVAEQDEGPPPKDGDPGPMFFMRILRADSTFAVISAGLYTTTAELMSIMAKKTFLQDELDKYQIVMRKQDTRRQLAHWERPLVKQKRLLEMAGYQENDRLEDLGREDHGYLCRFTFLPSNMTGYSSLDRDPGFNKMQRFNHIDLSGRNLITIPIALHQKATEIITLNLSRNLTLDIPKDFIQSCSQLREIKYTGNEARRLPPSLALANKLTTLDISNNRLDQLAHADLWKLNGMLNLKISNNKLTDVPSYFGKYRALRSLNLSSNSLTEFPAALRDVRTLVDLDISFNSISSLKNIGALVNLERLWATNNKLSGPFDDSFSSLASLRELDARFNAITNIDIVSQLPKLEMLMLGHNSVSQFEGTFRCLKILYLNHNPVTNFDLTSPLPTLAVLNMASAKLSRLPDELFSKMSGLTKLTVSKNHFVSLSPQFGRLQKLEYLSIAKNELSRLPAEIGRLTELRYLDVRENNLSVLPSEIWYARRLETLNVSSNVLAEFPKLGAPLQPLPAEPAPTPNEPSSKLSTTPEFDELGKLEDFQNRRTSQAWGVLNNSTPPRQGSSVSHTSSKPSQLSRTSTTSSSGATVGSGSRKESSLSGKFAATFCSTLRHLFLADNRLEDDVFNELVLLPELRILNLSYNHLYDVPPRTIKKWPHLSELYLSGNDLTSIPSEDLEEGSPLKVLHINSNKFQTLPAELGNVQRLAILDVGNNVLKYNVSNWPYDWNWNQNPQLRYLNLSGNKRLEIRPNTQAVTGRANRDLTDFSSLVNLRILGLMDVTLTIPSVPDQAPDRRVRLAGSMIGNTIPYGMADTLGRNEHLSTLDLVVPRFRGHEDEALIGLFDGQSLSSGGSKVAKFLQERFKNFFIDELEKIGVEETPFDALRRTYLGLNKELATIAVHTIDQREHPSETLVRGSVSGPELSDDDLSSGSVATVMYLHGTELYISNVGDAQALLIQSEGSHRVITRRHDPAEASERERIREAGGYVSRQGKLNDQIDVSRAFGYVQLTPCVIAAPHINKIDVKESDEMILLASRELWDYLTPDFAVDVARSVRDDPMRAAQKLRDLAIAFGATGKIMVMMVGISDLRKREKTRFRTQSMSLGPSGTPDDYFTTVRKAKRGRDAVGDSKLARLDQEVEAPQGDVTLVFTDIKNSTVLWETYQIAMQSAIKMHNEVMRRHLRIIGGYEVKTEGDAFMVAFPTVTSALLWAFTIQSQLLEVQWPQEILSSVHGEEMEDDDGNVIFRGLSVRMGIHWGRPVCEIDPVTKRMDYFGPMVNRAARIESVADGGQICVSSDFIQEVHRMLEIHTETDPDEAGEAEDSFNDDFLTQAIRRELRSLTSQGFESKDLGQRTLKGLENPEFIHLMYPHSLASRLTVQQQRAGAEAEAKALVASEKEASAKKLQAPRSLTVDAQNIWDLWSVSLRLEMLCSCLESADIRALKPVETALLEKLRSGGGEITDRFLVNFVEHQISRIETCISTLAIRNMVHPFKDGMLDQACPMADILETVSSQLEELKTMKEQVDFDMAPS